MKNELDMGMFEPTFTKESAMNTSCNKFIGLRLKLCILPVKRAFLMHQNQKGRFLNNTW